MRSLFIICVYSIFWRLADCDRYKNRDTKENEQGKYGQVYGNPVLDIITEEVKASDASDMVKMTCSIAEEYRGYITRINRLWWGRKAPNADRYTHFLRYNGNLTWVENYIWKKFDVMKKQKAFVDIKRGNGRITMYMPVYPCEDNGSFECGVGCYADTKYQQYFVKYYHFNDTAFCTPQVTTNNPVDSTVVDNVVDNVDNPGGSSVVKIVGVVAGGLLLGISLAVLCWKLIIKFKRDRIKKQKSKKRKKRRRKSERRGKKSSERRRKSRSPSKHHSSRIRDSQLVPMGEPPSSPPPSPPPAVSQFLLPQMMESLPPPPVGMAHTPNY